MSLSEDVTGHGMGMALEVKDWCPLTLSDVTVLQRYYPVLSGELNIVWHSPRPFSSACIVHLVQQDVLIKRSHLSFRSVQDIEQEHHFIAHLASQRIAVPHLYTHSQQGTAILLDDWVYEVHQKVPGVDIYAEQQSWRPFFYTQHAYTVGRYMARLHHAAKNYAVKHPRDTQYLIANQRIIEKSDVVKAINLRIANRSGLSAFFAIHPLPAQFWQDVQYFHQRVQSDLVQLPKLWTHNDLHSSNFIWQDTTAEAEIAAVIDFGLSDLTTAAYDIATAIERNVLDWLALAQSDDIHVDIASLRGLLEGYISQPHQVESLLILPKLLPLVHIDFALYELEYFLDITQNAAHADAAYAYLLEHLRWFRTKQGQVFLAQLHDLIEELVSV
ncbi:phosphotransferase enzyme family protein [Acinetobacter qingfengensis]|uniref:Aminoglycoside phosphotransferase domain-containing protein n=1 Tax=Acinetobacter qingfengensis TaxID=1262585 RepID=A0A1E7R3A0_9GAMM|nr:phosphotransferase [Acinetobacter qingfengensis]OEY93742.1 hypothetical protein BJI46_04690 [Acinetobacter qingfengensis]